MGGNIKDYAVNGVLRRDSLLMAFKLLMMAQKRWRRINGTHLIPLVRAEVGFIDGVPREGKDAA